MHQVAKKETLGIIIYTWYNIPGMIILFDQLREKELFEIVLFVYMHVVCMYSIQCYNTILEYSCNKYNNLIGQLEVHYFT